VQGRIQCGAALVRKHILDEAGCEICGNDDEIVDHIISDCSFVQAFWSRIGWEPSAIATTFELWRNEPPPRMHKKVAHPLILLLCLEIWKHRNEVVFRGLQPSVDRLVAACKDAARS
jgi:hypothetical protein